MRNISSSFHDRVLHHLEKLVGVKDQIANFYERMCHVASTATCDRIRLTADGQLRTCLFATEETDLRAVIRSDACDDMLAQAIRQAVWNKELKHYIGDTRFKRANRSMSMIGG